MSATIVNSGPGLVTQIAGQLNSIASVSIVDGRIDAIYSVSNPEKLRSLSSLSL